MIDIEQIKKFNDIYELAVESLSETDRKYDSYISKMFFMKSYSSELLLDNITVLNKNSPSNLDDIMRENGMITKYDHDHIKFGKMTDQNKDNSETHLIDFKSSDSILMLLGDAFGENDPFKRAQKIILATKNMFEKGSRLSLEQE